MTIFKVDCKKCANVVKFGDQSYCVPMKQGKKCIYLEPGHKGDRNDPDPVLCDYFIPKEGE